MLLVDTNILLAAADTSTADHARCAAVLDDHLDLAITAPVEGEQIGEGGVAVRVVRVAQQPLQEVAGVVVDRRPSQLGSKPPQPRPVRRVPVLDQERGVPGPMAVRVGCAACRQDGGSRRRRSVDEVEDGDGLGVVAEADPGGADGAGERGGRGVGVAHG